MIVNWNYDERNMRWAHQESNFRVANNSPMYNNIKYLYYARGMRNSPTVLLTKCAINDNTAEFIQHKHIHHMMPFILFDFKCTKN